MNNKKNKSTKKKSSKKKSSNNKKLLPAPRKDISLAKDGYKLSKSEKSRHRSLSKSAKKHGTLTIMKRLNLIRNLTKKDTLQKKSLSRDVEFLKKMYMKEKESNN